MASFTGALLLRRSLRARQSFLTRHRDQTVPTTPPLPTYLATNTTLPRRTAASLSAAVTVPTWPNRMRMRLRPAADMRQQRRSLFIQTATTPNPESMKFLPNGRLVLGEDEGDGDDDEDGDDDNDEVDTALTGDGGGGGVGQNSETAGFYVTRGDRADIARSPLAKAIFDSCDATEVKSVYLGYDFVTVTKFATAKWSHINAPVFGAIMDHYASGKPALISQGDDKEWVTDTTILDTDDEIVAMIKELLETRIRPAVQEDGGDIRYVGFEEETGIVTVQLAGSCVGCPSSSVTLKNGVENMLMHYIPEVTNVISQEEEEADEEDEEGLEVKVEVEVNEDNKKMSTYEERLKAAGIPFSD